MTFFPGPPESRTPQTRFCKTTAGWTACPDVDHLVRSLRVHTPRHSAERGPRFALGSKPFFYLILGMFLDSASVIVITTPIVLPFAVGLGYDEIWFGIFLMLAVELGNITPPVGVTLFAVQVISKDSLDVIAKGALPFWISFLLPMTFFLIFPDLVMWLPNTGLG